MSEELLLPFAYVFAGLLGAILGSFYYATATRVSYFFYSAARKSYPRKRDRFRALIFKPSFCMECGAPISRVYLIPVFGYAFSRARCAECGTRISPKHLVAEIYLAILLPALLYFGRSWPEALLTTLFAGQLYVSIVTDTRHMILDHENTAFLFLWAAILTAIADGTTARLIGGGGTLAIFGALYWISRLTGRTMMGFGDVPLSAAVGLFFGFPTLLIVFVAAACGSIFYSLVIQGSRNAPAPFGASLGFATLTAIPLQIVAQWAGFLQF
jgi:prepilin signal peptidase PulO-like enzyme (type II secretory pathway)